MLTVAIDESGRFENKDEKIKLVGGVIYKGDDILDEEKRLKSILKSICDELHINYPSGLHMMRSSIYRTLITAHIIKYLRTNGKYHFVYMIKSQRDREDYKHIANFIDEDKASNLYEHMVCELINNIVFFNHRESNERDYNLNLATRVSIIDNNNIDKIKEYEELGYKISQVDCKNERRVYLLNNTTFKSSLTNKMINNRIKKNVDITLNVESINYNIDETSPFLYLSDIACNIIRNTLGMDKKDYNIEHSYNELNGFTGNAPYIWAYDDIETVYRDIVESINRKDYFESLNKIYKIENYDSDFKNYYRKYFIKEIKESCKKIFNISEMQIYISKLEYYISKNNADKKFKYELEKTIFIGNNIVDNLHLIEDNRYDYYKFKMYDVLIRCYNHKGDIKKCYELINTCKKLKCRVELDEYINALIRRTEVYENDFNFEKSLEVRLKIRDYLQKYKLNNTDVADDLNLNEDNLKGLDSLAKIESAIGQTYGYMKNYDKALFHFKEALDEFDEDDNINREITTSYILHLAIDSSNLVLYERYSQKYFKSDDLKKQIELVLNEKSDFKLYVYVKALDKFYFNHNYYSEILNIIQQYNYKDKGFKVNNHPWELIYKRIAIMQYKIGNISKGDNLKNKAISCIDAPGATIKLINVVTNLEAIKYNKEIKLIKQEVLKFNDVFSNELQYKNYFNDIIMTRCIEDKADKLIKKFNYMYE